jgi:hypothetical protein
VDSDGKTLEFLPRPTRDAEVTTHFFLKALHRVVLQKISRSGTVKEKGERRSPMIEQHPFTWRHFQAEIIRMSREVVSALFAQLSGPRRNDAGTEAAGRPCHHLSLSPVLCA